MKQIVTINLNHICPMVTGLVPHVGGPIIGPGNPGVLLDGQPVAVMGDMCVCCGPPDTIIQGHPGMLIDGIPVAVQGSMTAHGGMIPMGIPGVTISSATPVKPVTMNIKRIPFPKIRTIDRVGAAVTGNSASLKEAETNIKALKEEATPENQEPSIYNVRWLREENSINDERIEHKVKATANTTGFEDGEEVTFTIELKPTEEDPEQEAKTIELKGVVSDGYVETEWIVET